MKKIHEWKKLNDEEVNHQRKRCLMNKVNWCKKLINKESWFMNMSFDDRFRCGQKYVVTHILKIYSDLAENLRKIWNLGQNSVNN